MIASVLILALAGVGTTAPVPVWAPGETLILPVGWAWLGHCEEGSAGEVEVWALTYESAEGRTEARELLVTVDGDPSPIETSGKNAAHVCVAAPRPACPASSAAPPLRRHVWELTLPLRGDRP